MFKLSCFVVACLAATLAHAQPSAPTPVAAPPGPPPQNAPPPPPAMQNLSPPHTQPLEPPLPAPMPEATAPVPEGQWAYTSQYGWLWMPYAQSYTHVVPDSAIAYSYVYYPTFGWRWVVAPWVLGFGMAPRWGGPGPARFSWYTRPWFRVGVPYHPFRGPGWVRPPMSGRPFGPRPFGGGGWHRR